LPAIADVPITHRWVGHVGTTLDFAPTIGAVGPTDNILFAGGYSGHGVTVAVLAGRLLRDLVAESRSTRRTTSYSIGSRLALRENR